MKTQFLKAKTNDWTITNAKGDVHILPMAIVYTKKSINDSEQAIVFALIFFAWQFRIGWIKKSTRLK